MARERDINEILGENADKIRDRVEDVRERLEDVAEKAKAQGEEAWNDGVKFVQKHPAQAVGIAALVGAALGVLLFARRRD